jgi:hypothetical protein
MSSSDAPVLADASRAEDLEGQVLENLTRGSGLLVEGMHGDMVIVSFLAGSEPPWHGSMYRIPVRQFSEVPDVGRWYKCTYRDGVFVLEEPSQDVLDEIDECIAGVADVFTGLLADFQHDLED